MQMRVEAVYENGVLRPLEPIELAEHQHVTVTVSTARRSEDLPEHYDLEFWETLNEQLKDDGPPPSLEEVRRLLSKIPGNMSDDFIEMRREPGEPAGRGER